MACNSWNGQNHLSFLEPDYGEFVWQYLKLHAVPRRRKE